VHRFVRVRPIASGAKHNNKTCKILELITLASQPGSAILASNARLDGMLLGRASTCKASRSSFAALSDGRSVGRSRRSERLRSGGRTVAGAIRGVTQYEPFVSKNMQNPDRTVDRMDVGSDGRTEPKTRNPHGFSHWVLCWVIKGERAYLWVKVRIHS
jgi:hypothetical protein